ncbi:protein translocase subunit SecD [Thalassiella azotivora]
MARTPGSRPVRTLVWLAVAVSIIFGTVAAGAQWSTASWTPKLALDLAGGTQIVLTPNVAPGEGEITDEAINEAIAIMRQRVDASGVSEATVSSQGGRNIVIELPGDPEEQRETAELVRRSAQMVFRPVLAVSAGAPLPAEGVSPTEGAPTGEPTDGATDGATGGATEAPAGEETAVPAPTATTDGRAVPRVQALTAGSTPAATTPAPEATAPEGAPAPTPAPTPTSASDLAWITEDVAQRFAELDCTDPANLTGGVEGTDPDAPLVTCSQDGAVKYVLGPVEVDGSDLETASSGLGTNSQGFSTGEWTVNLEFDGEGTRKFREVTERITGAQPPTNQFAIVLDGLVISAPQSLSPISDGRAQITGSFTQDSAAELANQLKFGALPISFEVQTEDQISAVLGEEQLRNGLLAGLIGLGLIVVYALIQYRLLGLLITGSLLVAGVIVYGLILLMGWYQGYRLSLPGVTGLIIAIGITADSFIVYFERIKDELREGRSLTAAVETGWKRAKRTIVISDVISLLAAVVLYTLAVGGVRGFAFTLGLTTLVDLALVFLFTHPVMVLLSRTRFFASGHPSTGMSAKAYGRESFYAGRGRVRTAPPAAKRTRSASRDDAEGVEEGLLVGAGPARDRSGRMTIAERKAASRRAGEAPDDDGPDRPGGGPADAGTDSADPTTKED